MDYSGTDFRKMLLGSALLGQTVDKHTAVSLRRRLGRWIFPRAGGLRILGSSLAVVMMRFRVRFLEPCTQVQGRVGHVHRDMASII